MARPKNSARSSWSFRGQLGAIALAGALAALATGCKDKPEEPEVVRPVRVVHILPAGAMSYQTLAGVAHASKEMALSFRVSGTIDELEVKRGQAVEKGDLIAVLDSKDAELDVQKARASYARAKAEHRSAQADYERVRLLYADGSVSRAELDASRAQEESTRAMLTAEYNSVELAKKRVKDHRLVAPMSGDIADVPVEVNENVQSGAPIALLNAGENIEVEVAVPERIIELFRKGLDAEVRFDSIPGEKFAGVVSEVGVSSDSEIGGFPIRVKVTKEDERLRAGLAALVSLTIGDEKSAKRIYVPPAAVQEDTKGARYVMVARPEKEEGFAIVNKRPVVLGEVSTMGLTIESGIDGGEMVVVAGLEKITDDMRVRLLPEDQPARAKDRVAGTIAKAKGELKGLGAGRAPGKGAPGIDAPPPKVPAPKVPGSEAPEAGQKPAADEQKPASEQKPAADEQKPAADDAEKGQ